MSCNGAEIIRRQFVSPIHLQLQGAQWFKVTKVEEIFEIFDKVGDVSYRIVAGNTGQGKEQLVCPKSFINLFTFYEGHLESKERFALQRYLLIIGKKQNMQVLSHTFTYFST